MGIGDDIMWRGEAYKKFKETGELQRPWNNKKEQYMNIETREVWKNVSWISRKGKPLDTLPNNQRRWYYNGTPYKPKVAPFEFNKEQIDFQKQIKFKEYIVINPYIKIGVYYPMKRWNYWLQLIKDLKHENIVICEVAGSKVTTPIEQKRDILIRGLQGPTKEEILRVNPNVQIVSTENFMNTASVMSKAKYIVTTEGATHHVAGNMQVPCITIYGSHSSPFCTGYKTEIAITRLTECNPDGYGCRIWRCGGLVSYKENPNADKCRSCLEAMDSIKPAEVVKAINTWV